MSCPLLLSITQINECETRPCCLLLSDDVMAVLHLDNQEVAQTSWKPCNQSCWDQRFTFELDRVCLTVNPKTKALGHFFVCSQPVCSELNAVLFLILTESWDADSHLLEGLAPDVCRQVPPTRRLHRWPATRHGHPPGTQGHLVCRDTLPHQPYDLQETQTTEAEEDLSQTQRWFASNEVAYFAFMVSI